MKYKKILISSAVVSLLMLILILCLHLTDMGLPSISTKENENDKIQLRFISSWGGSDTKSPGLEEFLYKFQEENPDIEIINESMAGEEFLFTLKMNFAEGNDPDVFGLWPGSDIRNLIKAGKVADLTDELKKDKEWYNSFQEDIWAYDTFNGRIYGLPCEIIYEGLFVNKDLFDKYGVKIPSTYDELKEAVKVFKGKGIIPIAYNSTPEGTYLYQNIVMKLAGKEGVENPISGGKLNSAFLDGIKYVKELYDLGAFPKDAFTIDNTTRNMLFVNKKAAMIVQGSWFIGSGYINARDSTVQVVPFPSFNEGKARNDAIIYGIGNGNFHMSTEAWKDKRKREACLKLLKALTSVETSNIFAKDTSYMSSIKVPPADTSEMLLIKRGYELINNSSELVGPTDSFVDRTAWEDILAKKFSMVLQNKISPEDFFTEIEKKMLEND